MIRWLQRVLFITTLLYCLVGYAGAANDLTARLNLTKTMTADFIQTIYDNRGVAVQRSNGTMAIERPGHFRWEVIKPIPQLIIANSDKLWIYDKDLEQVTIRTLKQGAGETPALFLSHDNADIEKDFNVQVQPDSGNLQWFKLTPTKQDSMFQSVEMGFHDQQIREIKLADNLGHTTRIEYTNIKTNTSISPSLFIFHGPAGIDVIDETHK